MAEGLNRVILIGNLGQDPELRYTQSNQGVLSLRMATTESFFDTHTKERKERTEWHTVVCWGSKRAEALNKILSKGSRIAIEGRLQTRSWEDKQGNKRYTTEINAQNVILLGGKGGGQDGGHNAQGGDPLSGGGGDDDFGHDSGAPTDDDIPFAYNESTAALVGIGKRII